MAGVVLAVVERPEAVAPTLTAAVELAGLMGAGRISALAIRMPPMATILPTEEMLTPKEEARIRNEEQARVERLRRLFDTWAHGACRGGIEAVWHDVESRAAEAVAEWGRVADAVAMSRPPQRGGEPERQMLQAALFETDRPILVVPCEGEAAPFGRRVAIAWRDDGPATRAVLAALHWLARAECVHVLAGARQGSPEPGFPDILAEHGIEAALHVLPILARGTFGETLLRKAHQLRADMLVMGAYTHAPLREFVLGGVTRYMLAHADLPVLMRH